MGIELASRATIIISVLTLGYNLYHLGNAYAHMRLQFQSFRQSLDLGVADASRVRLFNQLLTTLLPLAYLALLFFAGFAWWLLLLVACKYAVSGYLSDFFQRRVLQGLNLRRAHFRLLKVDAFFNVLLLALVLLVAVF